MPYFSTTLSSQEIISLYRKLALQHHPDRNRDTVAEATRIMQQINAEFDRVLKQAQRREAQEREQTARHKAATEGYEYQGRPYEQVRVDQMSDLLRQKIQEIITLEGITIELCGAWIWVTGNTRPVKEVLKAAGYVWASKKGAWYFKGVESRGTGKFTLEEIRSFYGSTTFRDEKEEQANREKRTKLPSA